MLLNSRPAVIVSVFTASVLAIAPPVSAGCLCDWLFGHHAPQTVAMPVLPAAPMPAATAYSCPAPVAAAPAAGYAAQMPATSYAAQMPAYGAVAPLPTGYAGQYSSLYGGAAPVAVAPATSAAPITSFYGSGNIYPPIQTTSGYSANYSANYAPAYTANYAANYTALQPVAAPVAAPSHGLCGCIHGFFGKLFGHGQTQYRTSYYQAPVTYYRPLSTVDPVSGSTVTVQHPCTSYQSQVQRMPYVGLQPATATPAAAACETPYSYAQPTYAQPTYAQPTQVAPPSEGFVPQPTLPANGFDPYATQSPATPSPYGSSHGTTLPECYSPTTAAPTTSAPLTGAPSTSPQWAPQSAPANGDRAPVQAPQLQRFPVPSVETDSSGSYWQSPPSTSSNASPTTAMPEPPSAYARPIPAPPATWSQPEASRTVEPQRDSSGGRTAQRPAWGFKRISWQTPSDRDVQQAGYDSLDASLSSPQVDRAESLQLNPAQNQSPDARYPSSRESYPSPVTERPAAPQQRVIKAYDDSGWRAAR